MSRWMVRAEKGRVWACGLAAWLSVILASTVTNAIDLVMWDWFEPRVTLTAKYIEQYQAENPDVHIEMNLVPDMVDKLSVALAADTPPDIVQVHNTWIVRLKDEFEPYPESLFPRAQLNDEYVFFDMMSTVDGKVLYLPLGIMSSAIYYNENVLTSSGYDSVPDNWADLLTAAQRLRIIEGDGSLGRSGFGSVTADFGAILTDLVYQFGGTLFDENGAAVTSDAYKRAADLMLQIFNAGVDSPELTFEAGQVAMKYHWTWYTSRANRLDFPYGMSTIPTVTGSPLPATARNNVEAGLAVTKDIASSQKEAAFKFIQWLFDNDDYVAELSLSLGIVPSRRALWNRADVSEMLPTALAQVPYTVYPGPVDDWYWVLLDDISVRLKDGEPVNNVLENAAIEASARWAEVPFPVMEGFYVPPSE